MTDGGLGHRLGQAGAEFVQESAPETLTVDVINTWIVQEERVLRLQLEDERFPARYERELAAFDVSTMTGALRKWALLKHLFRVRSEKLERRTVNDEQAENAARKLLRREPEVVWLAGRRVEITGRSYSAMQEIAAHHLRMQVLEAEREDLRAAAGASVAMLRTTPRWKVSDRRALRLGMAASSDRYAQVSTEYERHRRALYANAMTESGGPSHDPAVDAPAWWREMTTEDDAVLLQALWAVGPGRYAELGPEPRSDADGSVELVEDLGFASLFRVWEPKMQLEPAALYDRDLGQTLTAIRAGSIDHSQPDN